MPKSHELFDLFASEEPAQPVQAPSEGIFVDSGGEYLEHIGECIIPSPTPPELIVQIGPWRYIYSLSRRERDDVASDDDSNSNS